MRQLRQSIEIEKNRKRIEEIDEKVNKRHEEMEKKIEALLEKKDSEKCVEPAMEKEINIMYKRMEDFMEKKEREDRKNNIIIKGMKGNETGEALKKKWNVLLEKDSMLMRK